MPRSSDLFVDTSGWASFVYRPDPHHRDVANSVQVAVQHQRQLITTSYIITELVALLTRNRFPRPAIIVAINKLKNDPNVVILHVDESIDAEAWQLLQGRQDKDWSLVDAASFVEMQRFGIGEALTTDHHFEQAGFTIVP